MSTLRNRQDAERNQLMSLLGSLEGNATNINEFIHVARNYIGWGYPDPTEHLKTALRNYLEGQNENDTGHIKK